jgi:hypothetical protein
MIKINSSLKEGSSILITKLHFSMTAISNSVREMTINIPQHSLIINKINPFRKRSIVVSPPSPFWLKKNTSQPLEMDFSTSFSININFSFHFPKLLLISSYHFLSRWIYQGNWHKLMTRRVENETEFSLKPFSYAFPSSFQLFTQRREIEIKTRNETLELDET